MSREDLKKVVLNWMSYSNVICDPDEVVDDLLIPTIQESIHKERIKNLESGNKDSPDLNIVEKCAGICEKIATSHWRRESYSHEQVAIALEEAADTIRGLQDNSSSKEACGTCGNTKCATVTNQKYKTCPYKKIKKSA